MKYARVSVGFQNKLATVQRVNVHELETPDIKNQTSKDFLGEDRCQDRVDYRLARLVYAAATIEHRPGVGFGSMVNPIFVIPNP